MEREMIIDQLFLDFGQKQLYVTTMKPENLQKREGYIVIHPFGEEKKSAHRALYEIAEEITNKGYWVCMFDLSGCGESQGSLSEVALEDWYNELAYIENWFKTTSNLDNIHFIGLRLGAFMAAVYTQQRGKWAKAILLEPVTDLAEYLKKLIKGRLFKELVTQGYAGSNQQRLLDDISEKGILDIDGHLIGTNLLESFKRNTQIPKLEQGTLVINITLTGKLAKSYQKLTESGIMNRSMIQVVKCEPFWDRIDSAPNVNILKKCIVELL